MADNMYDKRAREAEAMNARIQQRRDERNAQASDQRFQAAAAEAARKNPTINPAIFQDIANVYRAEEPSFRADVNQINQTTPAGLRPSAFEARRVLFEVRERHYQHMHDQIVSRHGDQGEAAWQAMGKELNPPGLIERMTKAFYDSDRGGIQWGGIAGAVAGLFMGMKTFNPGDWLGLGAIALMTGLGAWSGNKLSDGISQLTESKKPQFPAKAPTVGQGPSQDKGNGPEPDMDAARRAADAQRSGNTAGRSDEPKRDEHGNFIPPTLRGPDGKPLENQNQR